MKEKLNNWKFLLILIAVGIIVVLMLFAFLVDKREAKLSLSSDVVTLTIGKTWEVPVEVEGNQTMPELSFSSENAAIASVDESGTVTALREGETKVICATEGGQKLTVKVSVGAGKTDGEVIYLTYENGPSRDVTPAILDLLEKYEAKATFFPLGQEAEAYQDPIARAAEEGHTIGVYTYSDEYSKIYESVDSYEKDFVQTEEILKEITGQQPEYWRFPGGSINEKLSDKDRESILKKLHRRGFVCVDWNCYVDDLSAEEHDAKTMEKTGIRTIDQVLSMGQAPVVRLSDSASDTEMIKVTKRLLKRYKKKGYEFRALSSYEGEDITVSEK